VTATSARLNATVNPNGGEVSECELEYGATTSYGSSVPCAPGPGSGTSPVAVSASLSSLSGATTYHFRVVAANAGGISYGGDESLTTPPEAPTVVTGGASEVTATSARLNAAVNPNGGNVSECEFEYGTTTSYGASTPCVPAPGEGRSAVAVSASLSGLSEGTTYHFRVVAHNVSGTSSGSDAHFGTLTAESPPEFGRCLKTTLHFGEYSSATCATPEAGGSYDWRPDFGAQPILRIGFTTALKPSATPKVVLELKGGQKVHCSGQTGAGEYSGPKALAKVSLKLTGCYLNTEGDHCTNTSTPGEIVANTLSGTLGIVKEGSPATKDTVGIRLAPAGGTTVATFTCESVVVTVRGSVILQGKANSMSVAVPLTGTQAKGVQKWTHFIGGAAGEDVLEAQIGGGAFMQAGLSITTVLTNEEKIEASTII
jgi:hypothetical protein